jgi:hypothetical protein
MRENTIDGTAAERATIARWENEGGLALPVETRAAPADLSRSDSQGGVIGVDPRSQVRLPLKRSTRP